jgi:predicted amidohydrolase
MYRIALAQLESSIHKQENLSAAVDLTDEAKRQGAELIAFPEFLMAFSPPSQSAAELARMAEPVTGPFVSSLCGAAKSSGIAILATIYEPSSVPDRVYDTAVWIDRAGAIAAVYRKLHLYDAFGFKESDKFVPGDDLCQLVQSSESRFGLMICYDLRFPEMARMLALDGANVLIAPSGWVRGDLKVEHWQTLIRARAVENGCYVIAPDQVGAIYIGHSMAVDPLGRTVIDLEQERGMKIVELDLHLVRETRDKLPLLENRRSDVYARRARSHHLP